MRIFAPLVLGAVVAGCAAAEAGPPAGGEGPLKVEAIGVLGGATAEGALSPDDLSARVERLVRENRRGAAERLVRRHPDAAWAALSSGRVSPGRSAIAWFHDRHASAQGPEGGWTAFFEDRSANPDRYRRYDESRERILRLLREGRSEEAAELGVPEVPEDTPAGPVLRVEASRLAGAANLLAGRPGRAAEVLESGAAAARAAGRGYDLAHLLLLLAEARRRAGSAEAAGAAWREAVETAAALADRTEGLFDPGFWERAANLKPPGASWPRGVGPILSKRSERALGFPPGGGEGEALLWVCVGTERLARGEAREAFVAFARSGLQRDPIKLAQAKALAALGEIASARALLAPVAARGEGPFVRPAEALMGALELKLGASERAIRLLRRALEGPEEWPGRADAEANLGLALLSAGQEKEGLRRLREAQARYEAVRDTEGLIQALRNELRWAEGAGRPREAERVRARLAAVEGS